MLAGLGCDGDGDGFITGFIGLTMYLIMLLGQHPPALLIN